LLNFPARCKITNLGGD